MAQAHAMLRLVETLLPQYPLNEAYADGLPAALRAAYGALKGPTNPPGPAEGPDEDWTPPRPGW